MRGLDGKVALVTGAGGGIGSAVATRLAEEGAAVAVTDVNLEAGTIVAKQLEERGGRAIAIEHDVTDRPSWEAAVDRVQAELGSLDIVVNNAGFTRDRTVVKMTDEEWQAVIDVHLRGCFLGCQHGLRAMRERGWGRIVSLSSTAAFGWFGQTNYAAAKAGIIGITKTVAMEAAKYGVTVNAIAPGSVDTPMLRAVPAERLEEFERDIPLQRFARPEEMAAVIAFLASDDASYITGQVIIADGGASLG
jgi:3-oxoacyl-[acyl-carrier protein] reductase